MIAGILGNMGFTLSGLHRAHVHGGFDVVYGGPKLPFDFFLIFQKKYLKIKKLLYFLITFNFFFLFLLIYIYIF